MKNKRKRDDGYYDLEDLKRAQKLSYGQRMERLEQINKFLSNTMPSKSLRISLKLRAMGF